MRYLKFRVNPDNSRVMSALAFLLFKSNTLHKETLRWNHYILGQPKPWCNDSGVLNVHHDNDVTTQYHVVQISQLENRNSYIWWNLNHAYSITRPQGIIVNFSPLTNLCALCLKIIVAGINELKAFFALNFDKRLIKGQLASSNWVKPCTNFRSRGISKGRFMEEG